jgi:hypothetical protein
VGFFSTSIVSGDVNPGQSAAKIPALLVCTPSGTVGTVYTFDPGDDIKATLGGGKGTEAVYAVTRAGARVRAIPCTPTWATLGSITKVGGHSGPTITVALVDGAKGPFDDFRIRITVSRTGDTGEASIAIAYDGSTDAEELPIPPEGPAIRTGTVDLNAISYPWSALNGTTLQFTDPSATTITFASAPTSVQDVIDDFNALAIAAPLAVRARPKEGTGADLGKTFFELYTTALGSSAALTIDAASTGEALLGLATTTANGTASTITLPYTNLKFTFPSGADYTKDQQYTLSCTGPRASISALVTGATAARDAYNVTPFGFLVVCQEADTASNCAALESALSTLTATWLADDDAPIGVYHVIGSPFHTASSTRSTNETNIGSADAALLTAFAASSASMNSVAHDDVYLPGSAALHVGSFRRTAAIAFAQKKAAVELCDGPGTGPLPEGSLRNPDGLTWARDENTATTKLGGPTGAGFCVLHSRPDGIPKFAPGATRAGSTSRLNEVGRVAVALRIAQLLWVLTAEWEADPKIFDVNPADGKITDESATSRADALQDTIDDELMPDPPGVRQATAIDIAIDNSTVFQNTGVVPIKATYVPRKEVENVAITITALGVTTIQG